MQPGQKLWRSCGPGNAACLQDTCPLKAESLPPRPLGLPGPAANVGRIKERPQAGRLERLPHAPCALHGLALHLGGLQSVTGFTAIPLISQSQRLAHIPCTLHVLSLYPGVCPQHGAGSDVRRAPRGKATSLRMK